MVTIALRELLQVANSTTTTSPLGTPGRPFLLTAVEITVLIVSIAVVGTLFSRLIAAILLRAGASKRIASTVRQWLSVLMVVSGVAGVTYLAGLSSEFTTLTISGLAGLAVSLALQNTLSNIISGIFLINDGVIRLGDDIQFGGPGGVRGEVVKLSLRTTWIMTKEGVITVIGNSNLYGGPILNYSAKARLGKKLQV